MSIYRVLVLKTESKQQSYPASWDTTVLYCATSYEEARIAFLKSEVHDYSRGLGNSARKTTIEKFASFPKEIDSIEPEELQELQDD